MSIINDLMQQSVEAKEQADAKHQEALEAQIKGAREVLVSEFGELWAEMEPYAEGGIYDTNRDGQVIAYSRMIQHPKFGTFYAGIQLGGVEHGGAPHHIFLSYEPEPRYARANARDKVAVGTFFRERLEVVAENKKQWERDGAKQRERQILHRSNDLRRERGLKTPDEADGALAELIELASDREEEWQELRQQWQWRYEVRQEEERARDEFEVAYRAYCQERAQITEHNRPIFDALQEELAQEYTVYDLVYGVPYNDEGETIADTITVNVLEDGPDEQGFWTVVAMGHAKRKRFFNLVSISEGRTVSPIDSYTFGQWITVDELGPIWFAPTTDRNQISQMLNERLKPLPPAPEIPDGMDFFTREEITSKIEGEMRETEE